MVAYIINAIAIAVLSLIKEVSQDLISQYNSNIALRNILTFIYQQRFSIVFLCIAYTLFYSIVLKWLTPEKGKKELVHNILTRMNSELLGGDQHIHRITLFKEVSYPKALYKNYKAFLYHLVRVPNKAIWYIKPPKIGNYLGIYMRCGTQYKKSSTMFRVEENDPRKCNGVATYIRYCKMAVEAADLPDITDLQDEDFIKAENVDQMKRTRKKDVESYMQQGFVSEFNVLRKMHRRARHFYGTVIQRKNGSIWGVLLADSILKESPFDEITQKRFRSFAETISGIVNMEV